MSGATEPVAAAAAGRGEPEVVKLPLVRRAMVRQMAAAATIPCFYLRTTVDLAPAVAARAALRAEGVERPPSLNDVLVAAVARALRAHADVNASFDAEAVAVQRHPRVNVGVAIAIPGALVVPCVYDADTKAPAQIGPEVRDLAARAAARKLGRDELADATFTVSNLGMLGIEDFDPLLNPPQAAILAVGALDAQSRCRLSLGCDHRVLTGAEGAEFLATLRTLVAEDPMGVGR